MIDADFHIHTCYCDGKNTPEDIVNEAISRGMKKLGFSGHAYVSFEKGACMSPEETREYINEINRLKRKYEGQIKILLGTECDYFSEINSSDYDYIIGSVHYVFQDGKYLSVDHTPEFFVSLLHECNDDPYEVCEKYYALVADVVNKTNADVIGHFDLVTKFNERYNFFDENDQRYINATNKALDALLKTGKPFEINTGAISRGWRTSPYPSRRILEYIAANDGSVILSSDSHQKETLMYKFDECLKLVDELGLKRVEL